MTVPPDFQVQLVAWGDDVVAAAERSGDPYVVNAALKERLARLSAQASEREVIYDLLIDWLASPDLNRWHPALMVLLDEGVARAAPAVRAAAEAATTDEKRSHARTFAQVAQELDHPPVFDVDPATKARWEAFEAALLEAATQLPDAAGTGARRSTVEVFVDDGDYTNALLFAAGGVDRSDGRPQALTVAKILIPEIELWLEDASEEELAERDRVALQQSLETLRTVLTAETEGTSVPPGFRAEFEAWWGERTAETPSQATVEVRARLADCAPDAPERGWIYEILIGWLYAEDPQRWQPAFAVLLSDHVRVAAPELRFAAALAFTDDKLASAEAFRSAADDLERD